MPNRFGRCGRTRLLHAASGTLGLLALLAGVDACSAGATRQGEAAESTGQASLASTVGEAPASVAFGFDLDGQQIEIALERARPPTTSDYRSFRRTRDGRLVPLPPPDFGCIYRGVAVVL